MNNPDPNSPVLPVVRLKQTPRKPHPWILWKEVEDPSARIAPGTVVDIQGPDGQWVARGFYNGHSRIRLRPLTRNSKVPVDAAFFRFRLGRAIEFRRALGLEQITNAYRVVHAEGDELSGLVVDKFGDLLVIEYFSAGMFKQRNLIREILGEHFPGTRFFSLAEKHIQKQESFDLWEETPPEPFEIVENGIHFKVAPGLTHKTGFFTDQRENRGALTQFTAGKRVLDVCCHSGGFALYAKLRGGAAEVIGIDREPMAIQLARENADRNRADVRFEEANLFDWIKPSEKFDTIVLDPAKQTRSSDGITTAVRSYYAMNKLALGSVRSGGFLVTCSCSGQVREDIFLNVLRDAAFSAGRTLQIFRVTGAAADHPFTADAPESRYLKAVWARVT